MLIRFFPTNFGKIEQQLPFEIKICQLLLAKKRLRDTLNFAMKENTFFAVEKKKKRRLWVRINF